MIYDTRCSQMLKNGRQAGGDRKKRQSKDNDDVSVDSQTSQASSVLVELDAADMEVMRLAVGKVVDGFMRMILVYYGYAWKAFVAERDRSRHLERCGKAVKIQCWFRGCWTKLGVRRRKEQVAREEAKREEEEERMRMVMERMGTRIQAMIRGFLARSRHRDLLKRIAAARVIQKAWERKKVREC